jgi:hypothetical protein
MLADVLNGRLLPASGVGPLQLGIGIADVLREIGEPSETKESVGRDGTRHSFLAYPGIAVHLIDGRVEELIVEKGFLGSTPDAITVGTSWGELSRAHPGLTFDGEEFHAWIDRQTPGIWFRVARPTDQTPAGFIDEEYEVTDPDRAFVIAIHVARP